MSLPAAWVDKIFTKLTLVYGRDFIGRWEGLELADVKTDWGHELAGLEEWPEAIAHALEILPHSKPPTVLEFRQLAHKAPRRAALELPAPPADPGRVADELRKLAALNVRAKPQLKDEKEWAKRLKARHDAGDPLKPIQIRFYREALRLHLPGVEA